VIRARRAFDVGEEKGDDSRRQAGDGRKAGNLGAIALLAGHFTPLLLFVTRCPWSSSPAVRPRRRTTAAGADVGALKAKQPEGLTVSSGIKREPKLEPLGLTRETIVNLTEEEAGKVNGG
jgi:hypothetical protein